jgi:hypothetical protein
MFGSGGCADWGRRDCAGTAMPGGGSSNDFIAFYEIEAIFSFPAYIASVGPGAGRDHHSGNE